MIVRAFLAVFAVVAIPIAVQGAENPPRPASKPEKRTCTVDLQIGSRLGGVRRCRSASERAEHKAEARRTVDRIQSMKATICTPTIPC
ncbi:MAG TPA: hypothetical protein VEX35_06745 [Allosphingosinicella sp.]|nr:hypothetical protein [Allosphingosinicella sp.]